MLKLKRAPLRVQNMSDLFKKYRKIHLLTGHLVKGFLKTNSNPKIKLLNFSNLISSCLQRCQQYQPLLNQQT